MPPYANHNCQQLKHDNIVNLIEVFRRKSKLHLVFEYVERTILEDLERNPDGMDPIETKKCLWQLLRSIDYCHTHNIIHRDIKPENLLISRNGILKLCDFGFARTLAGPGARYTDYVATRWYRGPELLTGDTQYGKPVDIWAIGCMLPEMASGAPLFPGESDIDQLFHIMRCFGQLPPKLLEVFRQNPLFIGIKIPDNVQQTETLKARFPTYPDEQLDLMTECLRYEPEQRCTCAELMNHRYFTENGFVEWFDYELKQMLERDAADFKMRQKKFRKAKIRGDSRGEQSDSRPQSQPPASVPPPLSSGGLSGGKSHFGGSQPPPPVHPPPLTPSAHDAYSTGEPADDPSSDRLPTTSRDGNYDIGPPHLEHHDGARRPATRGSDCGGGSADFGSTDEMPHLPNLQRPTTPRAQRLVAFPQLASAVEEQGTAMPMGHTRGQWGGGGQGVPGHAQSGFGKAKAPMPREEMPAMPSLSQAMAPAMSKPDVGGGSNLPQLKEGQLFAADLPERYGCGLVGGLSTHGGGLGGGICSHLGGGLCGSVGGSSLGSHALPGSRGGGGSKKKASAYDPSNPYFSKPSGKLKVGKAKANTSHVYDRQQIGLTGASGMGIIGQAHSMSGLASAYALPSSLPPRTPNHDFDLLVPPPRTPGETSVAPLAGGGDHTSLGHGISGHLGPSSTSMAPLGTHGTFHGGLSHGGNPVYQRHTLGANKKGYDYDNVSNYAKYGKRY